MTIRSRLLWMISLIPALAACPSLGSGPEPEPDDGGLTIRPPCNQSGNPRDCAVPVTIVEKEDGSGCGISIAKEQYTLEFEDDSSNRDRFIFWELKDAPGYSFSRNGVEFKRVSDGNFTEFKRKKQGQVFRVKNRNRESERETMTYEYGIYVFNTTDPTIRCYLDPYIRNVR